MWRYKNEAQPPGESGISTIALKNPRVCRARNLGSAAFKSPDVQWLKAIDSTVGFYSHIGGMVIRIFNIPLMSKLFGLWDDKLKHRLPCHRQFTTTTSTTTSTSTSTTSTSTTSTITVWNLRGSVIPSRHGGFKMSWLGCGVPLMDWKAPDEFVHPALIPRWDVFLVN